MFSIGELSARAGVKVPTIRYYEGLGLIAADERTAGNQRRYSPDGLDRLSFIKHARDLGLPLEMIRALLALDRPGHDLGEAHRIAGDHLADIRARIRQLQRLEAELVRIVAACDGDHQQDCGIRLAFGDHARCASEH